jgi:hypothetical protein
VAVNDGAEILAIGAPYEGGQTTGNEDPIPNDAGAAYVYTLD